MSKPTMTFNKEFNGIELKFESKPAAHMLTQVKEQGFRWHREKKVWYAKDTPARRDFAEKLCGVAKTENSPDPSEAKEQPSERAANDPEPISSAPNTFASHYDKIGDAVILSDADTSLLSHIECYCEKEQLHFRRTYGGDSIYLTDLSNAQKTGKDCEVWSIYPSLDADRSTSFLSTLRQAGAETVSQLIEMCRSGNTFDGVSITKRAEKGVDVFSPFVEVKPLKELPEKWTKRNFTQALMSGQLFRGEVAYRYTDDYAYDAAYDFGTGRGMDMPSFAKNEVGEWGTCTSCYSKQGAAPDKTGAYEVSYSEHSNSCKTLYFDVNCDIAEGKRRAEQRSLALQNYNKMMESSCIEIAQESIDPTKIYHVVELDMNTNTGVYGSKESNLQGEVLRDRLDPDCRLMSILSVEEMDIRPDLLYSVGNFHHRLPVHERADGRIIPVGNWEHIVTGKALLELTAEGRYFPYIAPSTEFGPSFEQAYDRLSRFADGTIHYMIGADSTDYHKSMDKLLSEYVRAGGTPERGIASAAGKSQPLRFDDMLRSAKERQANQHRDTTEKSGFLDFNRA